MSLVFVHGGFQKGFVECGCVSRQRQATGATTDPWQRVTLFQYLTKLFLRHELMCKRQIILSCKHNYFGIPSFSSNFCFQGRFHPPSLLLQGRKALPSKTTKFSKGNQNNLQLYLKQKSYADLLH